MIYNQDRVVQNAVLQAFPPDVPNWVRSSFAKSLSTTSDDEMAEVETDL